MAVCVNTVVVKRKFEGIGKPGGRIERHVFNRDISVSADDDPLVLSDIFSGDSPGGENAGDCRTHDAAAFAGAVARHEDAGNIRFQVFVGDEVRVEKLDFRRVKQCGGM